MKYFLTGLSLVLIAAKLFGAVTISWFWALSPLWIPMALGALIFLGFIIVGFIKND